MRSISGNNLIHHLFLFVLSFVIFSIPAFSQRHRSTNRSSPGSKTVRVKLMAGIYRDWDKSWMTTAPQDVVATLTSSAGSVIKQPANYDGLIVFDNVPCGEQVKINLKFVGTASYKSNSRNYTRQISCGKPEVNLGKLEYGTW